MVATADTTRTTTSEATSEALRATSEASRRTLQSAQDTMQAAQAYLDAAIEANRKLFSAPVSRHRGQQVVDRVAPRCYSAHKGL
jgi:cellobiose-specific phosphotransferase system component IIA